MTTGVRHRNNDLIDVLGQEEDAIAALSARLETPAAQADHVRRAALGMELVNRVALYDLTRHRVLHSVLVDRGEGELAEGIEDRVESRRPLMKRLGSMTSGVSARDVHVADGPEFDDVLDALRVQVCREIESDRRRITPLLRERLSARERTDLGARAVKVLRRQDEGGRMTRGLHTAVGRIRNFADTPHHSEHLE